MLALPLARQGISSPCMPQFPHLSNRQVAPGLKNYAGEADHASRLHIADEQQLANLTVIVVVIYSKNKCLINS